MEGNTACFVHILPEMQFFVIQHQNVSQFFVSGLILSSKFKGNTAAGAVI